ncbi:MAG: nickel-type superoxide dismutase maturation protease [Actinobacteria bacterium]|nr:nickel-type superoxide dismutase maturation protease [Actinomycetota bacterium]
MLPTLRPGDLVVTCPARRLRVGQLVVVRDPRETSRTAVKRVVEVTAAGVEVRGDNPLASTDSRTFGPVPLEHVEAIVLFRWPISRGRRGGRVRSPRRWG